MLYISQVFADDKSWEIISIGLFKLKNIFCEIMFSLCQFLAEWNPPSWAPWLGVVVRWLSSWSSPSICLNCVPLSKSQLMIFQSTLTLSAHFCPCLPILFLPKVQLCRMAVETLLVLITCSYPFNFSLLEGGSEQSSNWHVSCLMVFHTASFLIKSPLEMPRMLLQHLFSNATVNLSL